MRSSIAFVFVLASVAVAAEDAASLLDRLPADTAVAVVTDDVRPLLARALGLMDVVGKQAAFAKPILAGVQEILGKEILWTRGPFVAGHVPAGGRRRWVSLRPVNLGAARLRAELAKAYGPLKDLPDVGAGAFVFRRRPSRARFWSFIRDGILCECESRAALELMMRKRGIAESGPLSAFYRERRKRLSPANGLAVLISPDVVQQGLDALRMNRRSPRYIKKMLGLTPRVVGVVWSWREGMDAVEVLLDAPKNALWRTVAPAPGGMRALGDAPEDSLLAIAGHVPDLAVYLRGVESAMAGIDPRIRDEFRQELAEYNRDAKVDFERDVLGGLGGDWAFAALPRPAGFPGTMLVLEVRDRPRLEKALKAMGDQAKFAWTVQGDVIRTKWIVWPVALTFKGKRLFVADSTATLRRAVGAFERGTTLAKLPALAPYVKAQRAPGALVYSSLQLPRMGQMRDAAEALAKVFGQGDCAVGIETLEPDGLYVARVELRVDIEKAVPGAVAAAMAWERGTRWRRQRTVSFSNLRQVGTALASYAGDYNHRMPARLQELRTKGYAGVDRMLRDGAGRPFLYFGAGMKDNDRGFAKRIIAASHESGRGCAALYGDFHVQWLSRRKARRVLAKARKAAALRAAPEKRKGFRLKRTDPFDKGATWVLYDDGVTALLPAGPRVFNHVLGDDPLDAKCIAFTKQAVWLGTTKGLLKWDRAGKFWTRIAVGGDRYAPKVLGLKVKGGALDVTIETLAGKVRCTLDLKSGKWRK